MKKRNKNEEEEKIDNKLFNSFQHVPSSSSKYNQTKMQIKGVITNEQKEDNKITQIILNGNVILNFHLENELSCTAWTNKQTNEWNQLKQYYVGGRQKTNRSDNFNYHRSRYHSLFDFWHIFVQQS